MLSKSRFRVAWAVVIGLSLASDQSTGDSTEYATPFRIEATAGGVVVVHEHDWSGGGPAELFEDLGHHDEFFGKKNDFSMLSAREAASGRELFSRPVPALTWLVVLDGGHLIVGLSNIMLYNPYQIVVLDRSGHVVLREHISSRESCLRDSELDALWERFPKARRILEQRVTRLGGLNYVDYNLLGVPNQIEEEAWQILHDGECRSHLSPNISESVTNHVYWYNEKDPGVRLEGAPGSNSRVLLVKDRKGIDIRFDLGPASDSDAPVSGK